MIEAEGLPPFANEPVLELRRAEVRARLAGALAALDDRLPVRAPVLIGDERRDGEAIRSTDPSAPDRVVALAAGATEADVDRAVALAAEGFRVWSARPARERAEILRRAAGLLRERRLELAALALREAGKPWPEADADVCEAIDFLEYYARGAVALEDEPFTLVQVPGERNRLRYVARGVVAVIAPWNFPIAIACGMVAAGLATGNAVVLKPAEQSPGCAAALVEALREAGVPAEALALLPGHGDVGAALVRHPDVHTVAFTGSEAVGLEILRSAAAHPGRRHLKRVVAEMGGKNCVIVDSDADLDDAVPAVVESAFGYAGQKCSAAARVLVHEAVHDGLLERLTGAVQALQVGPAEDLATDVPPVIEREARDRVRRFCADAERDGRVVVAGAAPDGPGWYCEPTVAADLRPDARLLSEEVFGPLLAVERVASVAEACERVEADRHGLTGALFSRNPAVVEEVVRRSPVGNLYVNRGTTGAMVGRQPFGGNRLSGTGTKAGGPDYLLQFVEPRVVTENTVRHGLVV